MAARIAIMSAPDLERQNTFLMGELSHNEELTVLEREEIAKVFREQNFQINSITAQDSIRLGQILKADGLVILEQNTAGLTTRLVEVNSGAVLSWSTSQLPIKEPLMWSRLRAEEVGRLAGKLGNKTTSAVPLSLMEINSPLAGEKAKTLEENLNSLLSARLLANPGVLVLERRNLQDALAEKAFSAETEAFLNGAWIIDGTVSEEASDVLLTLRLQPPENREGHVIKVSGLDLLDVVEKANEEVLKILKLPTRAWQPAEEADRFLKEAQWAERNGLWEQATRALEVAVAMGNTTPEVLRSRWKAYDSLSRGKPVRGPAPNASGRKAIRPTSLQIEHMARSILLCREALDFLPEAVTTRPANHHSQLISDADRFGNGPEAESSVLLSSAGRLIAQEERSRSPEEAPPEALQKLRDEMHLLYDAIIKKWPKFALKPKSTDQPLLWSLQGESMERHRPGNPFSPMNIQTERLRQGLLWETQPEAYFAFVRKCLVSDLEVDPYFFQLVLNEIWQKAKSASFPQQAAMGKKWMEFGKSLVQDPHPNAQIGGAVILSRIGLPKQGMEVFARQQTEIIEGRWPLEFLLMNFSVDPPLQIAIEKAGGDKHDATGALSDLLISLFKGGYVPSTDLIWKLNQITFSERQAEELLKEWKKVSPLPSPSPQAEQWATASKAFERNLLQFMGVPVAQQPAVPPESKPKVASSTTSPPASGSLSSEPLRVDLAWAAENLDDSKAPGAIRWAMPDDNKIWMQVEFPETKGQPGRRVFRVLETPSLKPKTIHRDTVPKRATGGFPRVGPTFATDGKGIYYWDGKGLSYVRDKKILKTNVPDLDEPLMWLIEGRLYISDKAGIILRYDPVKGTTEILASQRRRPAQTTLDSHTNLDSVSRIFRTKEGAIAANIGVTTYVFNEETKEWVKGDVREANRSEEAFLFSMTNSWEEAGDMTSFRTEAFLGERARRETQQKSSSITPEAGIRETRRSRQPLARYMDAASSESSSAKISNFVSPETASVTKDSVWILIKERGGIEGSAFSLLRLHRDNESFACRSLDLSPEFDPYQKDKLGALEQGPRILPVSEGVVLYSPMDSVLWFVPSSDLPFPTQ